MKIKEAEELILLDEAEKQREKELKNKKIRKTLPATPRGNRLKKAKEDLITKKNKDAETQSDSGSTGKDESALSSVFIKNDTLSSTSLTDNNTQHTTSSSSDIIRNLTK